MIVDSLTDDNFLVYAAHHYDNPQCMTTDEFFEDLRKIKYIKKLITRYVESGDLQVQLILNHLIVLKNVFGPEVTSRIVYLKMKKQFYYMKPFLVMLEILPDKLYKIGTEERIDTTLIAMDPNIVAALREI